jgi:hypothetical protein
LQSRCIQTNTGHGNGLYAKLRPRPPCTVRSMYSDRTLALTERTLGRSGSC